MKNILQVRELSRWGFDSYPYRPEILAKADDSQIVCPNQFHAQPNDSEVVLESETAGLQQEFLEQSLRSDLLEEMRGLNWSLGVVKLRSLIAFQRRISFASDAPAANMPDPRDWPALFSVCFESPHSVDSECKWEEWPQVLQLSSQNPNLHIRPSVDPVAPLTIHAGGPFFEVACYRDRWFLRDGYHRAYNLMRAGVFEVPAVIVQASTIHELGADQPWFFPEEVLFSDTPPKVVDFLNDNSVVEYSRPALRKTVRITIEEFLTPVTSSGEEL